MANLPVPNEQTWISYDVTAASTGPFAFNFSIFEKANLRVKVGETELAQNEFTFTGSLIDSGYDGGSIDLSVAAEDATVMIWRDVEPIRLTDYSPASSVPVKDLDAALDLLTAQVQDIKRDVGRTTKVPIGDDEPADGRLPEMIDASVAASAAAFAEFAVDAVETAAETAGDAQVTRIIGEGDTQVLRVSDEGVAQAAAVAAAADALFYADTAAGLAATSNGDFFLVIGDGATTYATLYKNNAGVAQLIANYPDAAALAAMRTLVPGPVSFVVTDEDGNILIDIGPDEIDHPDLNRVRDKASLALKRARKPIVRDPQWDGVAATAEIMHFMSYGQSLGEGQEALQPLTYEPLSYAVKFAGGVRAHDSGTNPAVIYASLQPYVETASGSNGETPMGGCLRMIAQLLAEEDGLDLEGVNQLLLGSAPGQGGQTAANLASGTYYNRMLDNITYGQSLAAADDKSYQLGALYWTQSESDYNSGVTAATWKTTVEGIRTGAQTQAQTVTGAARPLPMITYQTATHLHWGSATPTFALAQLELAEDNDHIAMATPAYFLPYDVGGVHLTNIGSAVLGAYYGLAAKRWLWDGVKPSPLLPSDPLRAGSTLFVRFDVGDGRRLVLDTTTVANPGNYGFSLVDNTNTAMTITSVVLVGRDTVKITASAPIPAGSTLRYAWIGDVDKGVGCVRDDAGDDLVFDPGYCNWPMHNWVPICSKAVS